MVIRCAGHGEGDSFNVMRNDCSKGERLSVFLILTLLCSLNFSLEAGDWPMWRYDSRRGSSSPDELPQNLELQWTRQLAAPMKAWPSTQEKLQFDSHAEPVVMGEQIFVPSSRNDSVTAYDTRTGKENWRFFTGGPVRFAPVAKDGKVFFNSDDGWLYAVNATNGNLIWKVFGGPQQRWLIGNHRMISTWPARGGVVWHQDRLYFAAGIWPFMGIFVHSLDPDSGEIIWSNSGDGTNYTVQPHDAESFAGLVPQGHLAAEGGSLIVPGGRSTPGIYETANGKQRFFNFDKRAGGHDVGITGDLFFTAGHAYALRNGNPVGGGAPAIFDESVLISSDPNAIHGRSTKVAFDVEEKVDRKGKTIEEITAKFSEVFSTKLKDAAPGKWFLRAGECYFSGGENRIASYRKGGSSPDWEQKLEGNVVGMLAADDRLFVMTDNDVIHCYGSESVSSIGNHKLQSVSLQSGKDEWAERAAEILDAKKNRTGFAFVPGIGSGRLIEELLVQSDLHVVAMDNDVAKVEAIRKKMSDAGLYGGRFSAIEGDFEKDAIAPYFANVIASEDGGWSRSDVVAKAYECLRPYGGEMWLPKAKGGNDVHANLDLVNAGRRSEDAYSVIVREGALPDTDDWTHQYGNAAQTVVSRDGRVKAPFGVLWFGGPSHEKVLPRHGHGPSPQVAGGRLFIEGPDSLRAVDVYTGRLLWEKDLKGLGTYYDTTSHFPGAGEIGSNYVSLPERIYVVYGREILELDSADGETLKTFSLPEKGGKESPFWGFASVSGDYLVATSTPIGIDLKKEKDAKPSVENSGVPVIPRNAEWSYLVGGKPSAGWTKPGFRVSADWKSGRAGFGYGDKDDKTELEMRGKHVRVSIRHEFEGKLLADAEGLSLGISFDDGFVASLNGIEVARSSVKGDPDDHPKISSHEADGLEAFELKDWKKVVRPGINVLSISGFNVGSSSSDFSLDPMLTAVGAKPDKKPSPPKLTGIEERLSSTRYASGSRRLVVFNRHTGEKLWSRDAVFNFRHNNISLSEDKLFCIDRLTDERAAALSRRGVELEGETALYALNLRNGDVLWKRHQDVFGTFLNYSAEHDILLQGGSSYRDRASDEVKVGLMALRGKDGGVLWHQPKKEYSGPCLLWKDQVITNGAGGAALNILTGVDSGWAYSRMYGCNTAVGSDHLMTFRSGAAGFFDLANHSGTGNLGGFKSSCTNNLIPANGVLNAPDYTRTCSCAYQNQTSLALIHMPEAEFWTYGGKSNPKRLGINFGAPGDRRSAEGTLYLEYPDVGGKSESLDLELKGDGIIYHREHASLIDSGDLRWVAASQAEGINELKVTVPGMEKEGATKARVKLIFYEFKDVDPGDRVFTIGMQGRDVAVNFDIVSEAGVGESLVKEFETTLSNGELSLSLRDAESKLRPILSGVEIILEE